MSTLHYFYDPLCGWCYGAAPLIRAARTLMPIRAHGGGMMAGERQQRVTPQLRDYVMPHDARIAQASGQPFGKAYFDGLLRDETALFDSEPPIAAILAAEEMAGNGLDMLARLQTAHYVEGQHISDHDTLVTLAATLGINASLFHATLTRVEDGIVQDHIAATQRLMAEQGISGFPTLLSEHEGHFTPINLSPWLGRPQAWLEWLKNQSFVSADAPEILCTPQGCALPGTTAQF